MLTWANWAVPKMCACHPKQRLDTCWCIYVSIHYTCVYIYIYRHIYIYITLYNISKNPRVQYHIVVDSLNTTAFRVPHESVWQDWQLTTWATTAAPFRCHCDRRSGPRCDARLWLVDMARYGLSDLALLSGDIWVTHVSEHVHYR